MTIQGKLPLPTPSWQPANRTSKKSRPASGTAGTSHVEIGAIERPLRNHETDTAAKGGRAQLPPLTSSPRTATRTKLFRTKINSNKRINGPEARKVAMQIRSCRARRKDPKLEDNGWGSLGAPAGVPLPTGARKEQHGGLRPVLANKPVSAHAVSDGQPATPASLKQRGLERGKAAATRARREQKQSTPGTIMGANMAAKVFSLPRPRCGNGTPQSRGVLREPSEYVPS